MKTLLNLLSVAFALLVAMPSASAGTFVQFRWVFGDVEIELYDQDKPVTVQNFLRYVQSGAYSNLFAHRLAPGFVIQAGAFVVGDRVNGPLAFPENFGSITNEYSVGRTFSNLYGTIAMARVGGQTNSASSQWFISLADNAFLDSVDGGFTVFGHTVGGTNVLNTFNTFVRGAPTNGVWNASSVHSALGELPLLGPDLTYENLVYVDITLLRVQVAAVSGGREISWNSVSNRVQRVEFTTVFPPQWQTLVSTNGTGARMSVVDPSVDGYRFYRVRVDY